MLRINKTDIKETIKAFLKSNKSLIYFYLCPEDDLILTKEEFIPTEDYCLKLGKKDLTIVDSNRIFKSFALIDNATDYIYNWSIDIYEENIP